MAATLAQINTALYNILDLLDGGGQPLSAIYDWPNSKPESYPCAYPMYAGSREEIEDTATNLELVDFIVRVIIPDENDETTYDTLLSTKNLVLAEFRKDDHWTLGGLVDDFSVSLSVQPFRTSDAEFPVIYFDVTVTCKVLHNVTV